MHSIRIPWSTVALLSMLVFGATRAGAQLQVRPDLDQAGAPAFVPGELLVKFRDDAPRGFDRMVHLALGSKVLEQHPRAGFQRIAIAPGFTEGAVRRVYAGLAEVEYAELNTICHMTGTPNDTYYGYQWHLPQINMPAAWDVSAGAGAVVAILDTGVAYETWPVPSWESTKVAPGVSSYVLAPDLAGTAFVPGYDFINNDTHPNDNNAHGTHVAGTIAQTTNNAYGVAGVAYAAAVMPVKVLDYTGSGTAASLANGLYYAADNGADVASMSLGWSPGYDPGATVHNAITYAYNQGVTLVAAAGNAGTGTVSYPAAYAEVIAVGAVRYDQQRSSYSQWGTGLEIMAPGGDVTVDQNGDGYGDGVLQQTFVGYSSPGSKADPGSFGFYFYQGTSMATPHVAGVCALLIAHGTSGPANVRSALQTTAQDLGAPGYDTGYGWGLVDAAAALNAGGGGPDLTPPNPDPLTWAAPPAAVDSTSITMTATTATDPSGVEYYFQALTGGAHDSGWQASPIYVDTGLAPNTSYSYRVQARDLSAAQNATGWSGSAGATTDPVGGGGWTQLSYDDFESGWGNWVDGGGDCSLYTGGVYAWQGNAAADIQDNSGTRSAFTLGSGLDLTGYSQLQIEFAFRAVSMENGEDFWVRYFDGSQWITVADFNSGTEFQNDTFYTATVTLDAASYNFPAAALVRFQCDASNNGDDVYVDTIRISAQ